MPVGKYAGKRIDQLPNSYLRWMLGQDFPKVLLEAAKAKVSQSKYSDEYITVSRHAIDMFSLRFFPMWCDYMEEPMHEHSGFGTYLANMATRAWEHGKDESKRRHQDDGIVKRYANVLWVFQVSPHFPEYKELITVMRV